MQPVPWQPTSLAIDPARPNTLRVGTGAAGVQEITLQQDLAIQLSPLAATLTLGVPVPYTVQVGNLGHLPSTGVSISIALPAGSSAVSANANIGSCTVAASSITCSAQTMKGDDSITVTGMITPTESGLGCARDVSGTLRHRHQVIQRDDRQLLADEPWRLRLRHRLVEQRKQNGVGCHRERGDCRHLRFQRRSVGAGH